MIRPAKDPAFSGHGRAIERFANHASRLIQASQKHRASLERAAAWSQGAAPLDRRPESAGVALKAIDQFARLHHEPRATLFGAYFAHHHLRRESAFFKVLARHAFERDASKRAAMLRALHARAELQRRAWISAFLERCLSVACPDLSPDDYAIFNVGALTDHEDVDLAIVCASLEARQTLDRGFGLVAKTFLRFASKLQLFLAEQLPGSASGALIEDYELFSPVRSVVVVMQLLGAQHLAGSRALARSFEERIADRFYAGGNSHEVFLRSVARELRHYHRGERLTEVLAPKREIYLPAKLITAAMRCVYGVREAYPPDALDQLADRDRPRAATYHALRDVFAANEVLRASLFWHVSRADEVDLYDPNIRRAARRVSLLFGLCAESRRNVDQLLPAAFQEMRAEALANILELAHTLDDHLRNTSSFRRELAASTSSTSSTSSIENVALRFADTLDDLEHEADRADAVELLAGNNALTARFLADLSALPDAARRATAKRLIKLLAIDPPAAIEFLILIGGREPRFWDALLELLEDPEQLDRFAARLEAQVDPEALLRLAYAFSASQLGRLADLLARHSPARAVLRALRSVTVLVHHQSNALGRVASRVLARTPELMERLLDFERLRALARDLVTIAAREPDPAQQIELLGDAFDVQTLRSALAGLLEGSPADRDCEWTASFDQHTRELIRVAALQTAVPFDPFASGSGLAVFATGGIGRGEAFAADWDYLALSAAADAAHAQGRLLQRLEGALVRRGIVPHNRLTQRFSAYTVSLDALGAYLDTRCSDTFIDEAEILEARFMFGDPLVRARFEAEIVPRVVVQNAAAFTADVVRELRGLRAAAGRELSLKEGAGGLREIHLLVLLLRVRAGITKPCGLEDLFDVFPQHRSDLRFLAVARSELRRVRDVYRLVVALDEPIDPNALVIAARDLAPLRDAGIREGFEHELRKLMRASAQRIDQILATITKTH